MPKFSYEAMTSAGYEEQGVVEAKNESEAADKVRAMGLFPTAIRERIGQLEKEVKVLKGNR